MRGSCMCPCPKVQKPAYLHLSPQPVLGIRLTLPGEKGSESRPPTSWALGNVAWSAQNAVPKQSALQSRQLLKRQSPRELFLTMGAFPSAVHSPPATHR